MAEGWHGWDRYAPFYDWENARTVGRRDVRFWSALARRTGGPVLELGCGTGRVLLPVARTGTRVVGVDRSSEMLARARARLRRSRTALAADLIRGDIRALPFKTHADFPLVMAPYGILQSLLRASDLAATLASVFRVTAPGALFGIDLVPDVPRWREYRNRVTLRGAIRGGSRLTLVESVRQDRGRGLTVFDHEYRETRRGRRARISRFSISFRTISVPVMVRRLERAGFGVEAVLGDYDGAPWDERADTWIILARRLAGTGPS
jgi:ubiquinone/menaquinone biosynthesis C-methylase UbiE